MLGQIGGVRRVAKHRGAENRRRERARARAAALRDAIPRPERALQQIVEEHARRREAKRAGDAAHHADDSEAGPQQRGLGVARSRSDGIARLAPMSAVAR